MSFARVSLISRLSKTTNPKCIVGLSASLNFHCCSAQSRPIGTMHSSNVHSASHNYYNYTSGKWLYSEKKRLSERHLFFDIHKLLNIIATSIGQSSDDIIRFAKIAEGGSYRVFEACFKDGRDIVARLPYPCTIPHQYGVASEVATIEYLRSHGVPAPKVLDWSSTSTNPIGNEYIIMEKARGRELEETWCTMRSDRRESLMKRIVNIEKLLFKLEFPASGSLYFMDSLPNELIEVPVCFATNFGWTPNGMYEEAKEKAENVKVHMLEVSETDEDRRDILDNWPFQDHEEID